MSAQLQSAVAANTAQMGMIVKFVFACLYFALEVIEPYNLVFFFQKLLRGVGLFAGSIFLMRNFGELMAI